ncbi:MAG: UDP-N-acetylmuramoyl-tripeptide--D-alanyl-D-alanine ligase [Neisseriaceae bacterium]
MKLSFLYQTFDSVLKEKDREVRSVVIDSRIVQPGDIFFAIEGPNFDGHDFAQAALQQGALAAVVSRTSLKGPRFIQVKDTVEALGYLAKQWRARIDPHVLAITGSSGKTTVKELTAAILRHVYGPGKVLANLGNLNNHLGLPLTLLRLREAHQWAVVEMGMNHPGEIRYLTGLAKPDIALVNNILRVHVGGGFNSLTDIARAKAEIWEGLPQDGIAVIPEDSPSYKYLRIAAEGHLIRTFGTLKSKIYATEVKQKEFGSSCCLHTPKGEIQIALPLPGSYNIHNLLAACALLIDLPGMSLEGIAQGLQQYKNQPGRWCVSNLSNDSVLIDDTYNANPDSMKAVLDVLACNPGKTVFVMGDMAELGEAALKMHEEVGEYAKLRGIDYLLGFGELTQRAVCAFGEKGIHFKDIEQLILKLYQLMADPCSVLVKGSRFMRMERICQTIRTEFTKNNRE